MKKNNLYIHNDSIIRVLDIKEDKVFIIDCIKRTMPHWENSSNLNYWNECTEEELYRITDKNIQDINSLNPSERKSAYEKYTLIVPILRVLTDEKKRSNLISEITKEENISKQTIRKYLCLYLAYQNISVLIPNHSTKQSTLTKDEKNMRWTLNKFYFSYKKHSLKTAYTMMLKEKYCDVNGELLQTHPTFNQFRYFYRKRKNNQTYYISRNGLTNYQRNNRPLLGDGIQEYAKAPGMGMLDSTICDVYLINEIGGIIGRPILTACIDAYSSLCCGYSLTWEGGIYSLRALMLNVITDKQELCQKHGITIDQKEWNTCDCPGVLVTDRGTEYTSSTFEQITELGIKIVNLPAYRPELKGAVEKFFNIIHDLFRPYLKGKGYISSDWQERGAHDYRKDACLTLEQFEKIIIRCILYYNSERIINNFPYTEDMLNKNIQPYANNIFQYGLSLDGVNLIPIDKKQLILTLLPRTTAKFTRHGLIVNNIRYKNKDFAEQYLSGKTTTVAYNPDDSGTIWMVDDGNYISFELIESRYRDKNFDQIEKMKEQKKRIINAVSNDNLQSKINLANHIETIINNSGSSDSKTKEIDKNKEQARQSFHVDHMTKVGEHFE